ncbi:hypothetical protein POM88_021486 [Heracleum sosnowskyi]|uniref:Uncharacterized protein n=1 Tax=Heracleum sosnowskyi TaxID=360622 RepID=A0AAD8IDZ2_9APIA|nr:hypothetical protein POM88_021486 [Heracleum sosnowskyi]
MRSTSSSQKLMRELQRRILNKLGMHSCITSLVSSKYKKQKVRLPAFEEVSVFSLVILALCFVYATFWAVTRKQSYSWIGQDVLGIGLMIMVLQLAQLPNIKVATALLSCAFCYDIFWVFISPALFGKGESHSM